MTCARREIVQDEEVGAYHCTQRCVRRSFLCGEDSVTGRSFEHRKEWVRVLIEQLASIFAIEVCAFAVMSNHMHVTLRIRPDLAADFSDDEVAARWWRLYPKRRDEGGAPCDPTEAELRRVFDHPTGHAARAEELRARLSSLSWFMRCLAEPISRRANREDGCKGHFWESRFKSKALLDEEAMLACGIYVDLNPIRAGLALTPETSTHTSGKERIDGRQARKKLEAAQKLGAAQKLKAASAQATEDPIFHDPSAAQARCLADAGLGATADDWLCGIGKDSGYLPSLDLDGYLQLLDWTGRELGKKKGGQIPGHLLPILERLEIDVDRWLNTVRRFGSLFARAAGTAQSMCNEAVRVSRRWLRGVGAARLAFGSG